MTLKNTLRSFRIQIGVHYRIFLEALVFFRKQIRHNASINTQKSESKMYYTLLRENHVIEKGLSLKNPRNGFGKEKVFNLINKLDRFITLYPKTDKDFLLYILTTVNTYIIYTKKSGNLIPDIESIFHNLLTRIDIKKSDLSIHAGIKTVCKDEIQKNCNNSFDSLLNSRHSIRYFEDKVPDMQLIERALKSAQRTPSACNRQAWFTHVFIKNDSHSLLKDQGGCRGFEEEIHCSILVTANLNAFLSYEVHQAYVDGGMYAMNLINCLHSLGLGTIPLSCGFYHAKLDNMMKKYNIKDSEVPIVIIGVGNLLEEFKVAISTRKSISRTNIYH